MNEHDELARRIAKLLDESLDKVTPEQREALTRARRNALSRYRPDASPVWLPAWAGGFSHFTERRVFGIRYLIPIAALVLGLVGVVYMEKRTVANDTAEIDANLLTDELPISAYLDKGFDSWLKRSSR